MSVRPLTESCIAALVTPYSSYGGIDTNGVGRLVEYALAGGVQGVLVNSEIGEGAHLSRGERLFVIEAAREAAAGRVPLYAATGAVGVEETLALTRDAGKAGVTAAFIAPPHYYALPQQALLAHYREIARRGRVPLVVANQPAGQGNLLSPESLATLTETPNIIGLVQGHPEMGKLAETLRLASDRCPILCGSDQQSYPALCGGATGLVSALGGVIPRQVMALVAAYQAGDLVAARTNWYALQPLARFLATPGQGVAACKAALEHIGLPVGAPRRPLPALPAKERAEIGAALAALGYGSPDAPATVVVS